jgi:CYTH domain-containing protein
MMNNPSAPSGKSMKYARREYERRFLLAEPPPGPAVRTVAINDRYLSGTTLRLRRMDDPDEPAPVFKLTQKIAAPDGGPGLITTMYLTEPEFELLATLEGPAISKVRLSIPPLGVDVFGAQLQGLTLAEAEFETEVAYEAFVPLPFVVAEVTDDLRFTGGRLAMTSAADLRGVLHSYGL